MNTYYLFIALFSALFKTSLSQQSQLNVSYGEDSQQVMDLYMPKDMENASKVLALVHGGAWVTGSKDDFNRYIGLFRSSFPDFIISNIGYRLANNISYGYPKQIFDLELAVSYLRDRFKRKLNFAFIGLSSGSHISMLYSYAMDRNKVVKVMANFVGPADLTDWNVISNAKLERLAMAFTGVDYFSNPGLHYALSPVAWINSTSAKTISFYGDKDELIPNDVGKTLKKRLDQANVTNQFYRYSGGHGDWGIIQTIHAMLKAVAFIRANI